METVVIEKDIKVYCVTATSFPDRILAAHHMLHAMLPSKERRFFGISRPENGVIIYKAAAEVLDEDKMEHFDYETFLIQKGYYRSITVLNYLKEHSGNR